MYEIFLIVHRRKIILFHYDGEAIFSAIISNVEEKIYIAIDLKSFYASVECRERGLDPLDTHLVVADESRTDKTICLAVSPSLKAYGLPGRCRLFEVREKMNDINASRRRKTPGGKFTGSSSKDSELRKDPSLQLDVVIAKPRMSHYIKCSTDIYRIYLRHISPEDIHVYSIDEVFIDATEYLKLYSLSARDFAMRLITEILGETGITATAGIGTNLYLAKVAMDIMAKHTEPDKNGVRIAELDEMSYRQELWTHRPLTDFWRVGRGYAKKLEERRIYTMGDIARTSERNEELLYRMFGINAELLIDHAWGWEPCMMEDIKTYKPASNSLGSGQVLQCPYPIEKARLVLKEMADSLSLDLVEKNLVCSSITVSAGYDSANMDNDYDGKTKTDFYGRTVPKSSHGTFRFLYPTSSSKEITEAALNIYDSNANPSLLIRRLYITAENTIPEEERTSCLSEPDLFTDWEQFEKEKEKKNAEAVRERKLQDATIAIKKRFGKNALLRGMSLEEGATARERNEQIGGHKA